VSSQEVHRWVLQEFEGRSKRRGKELRNKSIDYLNIRGAVYF
jgi:hypothetical protein